MNAELTKGRRNIQQPQHSRASQQLFLIDTNVWDNWSTGLTKGPPEYKTTTLTSLATIISHQFWDNLGSEFTKVSPEY
jgi:hypothetical protein